MRKIVSVFFALMLGVSPVFAGGILTLMGIGPAQNVVPPSLVYQGYFTDPTNSTSHSMSVNTGTAKNGRVVVVAVKSCTTGAVSGVTLGGVSMTAIQSSTNLGLYYIVSNSGTSATLAYTTPVSCLADAGVWSLYDLTSTTPIASSLSTSTSNGSCTIASAADGFMIAAANTALTGGSSISMSAVTSVNYSNQAVQTASRSTGGYEETTSTSASATITYSPTATTANSACATWR